MDHRDFLRMTQDGYDRTAAPYAERFHNHLDDKPVDRAMISAFAALVSMTGNHRVADLGCGTGVSTALLKAGGADAFGIDLSPNMIAQARHRNPELNFSVGSMTHLDLPDRSCGGVCAWYSIIHVPDDQLTGVFDEVHRVLIPGGLVLLAFQVGNEPRILHAAFGQRVELVFYRRLPGDVFTRLQRSGLHRYAELVREPDDDGLESTAHAYLIARK